jgi:SAM-dependent methyltransferase
MLAFACPICRSSLHPHSLTCKHGHAFAQRDGILSLLTPQFAAHLAAFTKAFQADRAAQQYPALPPAAYAQLPFGDAVRHDPEWRARQTDLRLILNLLPKNKTARVLDVGAWNGWLSHQLATRGHNVTAVAYFADAQDGLGARKFYPNPQWQAVQMDECDLDLMCDTFDVVILNHCVQFAPDPHQQVLAAQARVAPGGLLVVTGLSIFKDPSQHIARTQAAKFQQQHKLSLFLRPTRGYLDSTDRTQFQSAGLAIKPYWAQWRALLRSVIQPTAPRPCYGRWRR